MSQKALVAALLLALALGATVMMVEAQGPGLQHGFTYQGQLKNGGAPVNSTCDLQMGLWDALATGVQLGVTQTVTASVTNGLFTVTLNDSNQFGANPFNGNARWLATSVRCPAGSGSYTALNARQPLTPAPYALFAAAPWTTNGSNLSYMNGNVGIGVANPTSRLEIGAQDGLAIDGYQPYLTLRDNNSSNMRGVIQSAGGSIFFIPNSFIGGNAPVVISNNGNVRISPGAPDPWVNGAPTILKVGAPSGTVPLAIRQDIGESTAPTLAWFETASGAVGQLSASAGTFGVGATSGKGMALNVNGGTTAIGISSNGNVGIGYSPESNTRLTVMSTGTTNSTYGLRVHNGNGNPTLWVLDNGTVQMRSPGTTSSTYSLQVFNGNGSPTLSVRDDGQVWIGYFHPDNGTAHVCGGTGGDWLGLCSSAAEYVPTIDSGFGYPETGDLVSIAPNIANPYGDDHGPFVVAKSTQACDDNLLGYITNPEKGADGKKLNDHYLPLAIYGYFPAKVTTANGAIKRGDPLTSSSKVGYAMKATGACKVIGYALDDANADGTIQVFAHLSENTAPQVAALQKENADLRAQNVKLETRVNTLEQTSATLQERLSTLEQLAQSNSTPARSDGAGNAALLVIGGLVGIVVMQKPWQRGGG